MKSWLGVEDVVSEALAELLVPQRYLFNSGGVERGHFTCRLHLPRASANVTTEKPLAVVVHYVQLTTTLSGNAATESATGPPLTLGCLGDFLADADVSWQTWFGERGVRESTKLHEELSRFRAAQQRRASYLLAGSSTPSRQLRAQVDLACRIRCHVGVIGPSGCGASELAAIIHHASAPDEPLVCLDASLMDAELLEVYAAPVIAELREHGDTRGTLCLDRLDEMPADAQVRLGEWLETWPQRLRLLGIRGIETTPHCIPLIEPLADTMATFSITIPSLTSRCDDLELMSVGLSRSARLSREAIELLHAYPWPGQWDELTAAIGFASEMVKGDRIGREHLPMVIRSYRASQQSDQPADHRSQELTIGPPAPSPRDFEIASLDETVGEFEASLIAKAMLAADGNKAEAARRLGISRSRLLRKLAGESSA